ncbi:COX8B oxidase, partial [Crocuta crocuta]
MLRLASARRLLLAPQSGWVLPKAHVSAKPARTPTSPMVRTSRTAGGLTGTGGGGWGGQSCAPNALTRAFLTQEQAIGLSVMFLSFLIPAGWVLHHLDSYKRSSAV